MIYSNTTYTNFKSILGLGQIAPAGEENTILAVRIEQ